MGPNNKNNGKKQFFTNTVESLRDFSEGVATDAMEQIFHHPPRIKRSFSGEIMPGESIEIKEVFSGKREVQEKEEKKLRIERELLEEEKVLVEKRTRELQLQISAIHEEILKLASVTPKLSREVEIASFQAPADPSSYQLYFLERILQFIKDFRENIEEANVWLMVANQRSQKKNMWGKHYKKHGAKYLLSGEHYLTRSAG